MIQIPKYIFDEILSISKVLNRSLDPNSLRHRNAIRKASKLHKKLESIKNKKQ